jgi:hypothetical protein
MKAANSMVPFDEFGYPGLGGDLPIVAWARSNAEEEDDFGVPDINGQLTDPKDIPTIDPDVPDTKWDIPVYRPETPTVNEQEKDWEKKWEEHYKHEREEEISRAEDEGMIPAMTPRPIAQKVLPQGEDVVRHECDRSEMKIFSPRRYCMMQGLYGATERDIDDIAHKWDQEGAEYLKAIAFYPPHIRTFYDDLPYMHDAKIQMIGRHGERFSDVTVFRIHPATNDKPFDLEISSTWMDTKIVLPEELRSKPGEPDTFLFEEFQVTDETRLGIDLHFYLSSGVQYTFEDVDDIKWRLLDDEADFEVDLEQDEEDMVIDVGPEETKRATRLFTAIFTMNSTMAVFQVKSADWSTAWLDIQKEAARRVKSTDEKFSWNPALKAYPKNRNVYRGWMTIGQVQVEVVIINTKRGKPPGAEQWEVLADVNQAIGL